MCTTPSYTEHTNTLCKDFILMRGFISKPKHLAKTVVNKKNRVLKIVVLMEQEVL
jgi:hypothetical protein